MAAVQQIILHPVLTQTLRFWSTTVGRDKTYRTIQYASRFLAWYEYRQGASKAVVDRFATLKTQIGLTRKLMRAGKFLEHLQSATKALNTTDPVVKFTAIGRQLGYAAYLVCDLLQWIHGSKVYSFAPETAKKISQTAARFWLYGLVFNLISGIYKSYKIRPRLQSLSHPLASAEKEAERKANLSQALKEQYAIRRQFVQDALDFILPATSLGYFHFNEGILGAVGFTTAILGGRSQWAAVNGSAAAKK